MTAKRPELVVGPGDPTPPYEQVRRQLATLIRAGLLLPGERLPPVRQLAGDLGLATGTVARSYRELEQAGLVRTRRGGGTRVSGSTATATATEPARSGTPAEAGSRRRAAAYVDGERARGVTDGEILAGVLAALNPGIAHGG